MTQGIDIPMDRLSAEVLNAVIDEFISREGTDYGHGETTFEQKRAQVRRQLAAGEAVILFDPKSETVNIVLRRDLVEVEIDVEESRVDEER